MTKIIYKFQSFVLFNFKKIFQVISGCQKDFRNKPFPVHLRIEYVNNVLTILMSDGMTAQPRYELCLRAENIFLPQNGFLGISAATGGLAGNLPTYF